MGKGVIAVGLVLMMGLAGLDIKKGELSVGDFVAVNTYLIQLYLPLNFLGFVYREIRQAFVDLERMFGLLDVHPDVDDLPDAPELNMKGGEIRFENVHFAYHDRPILKGLSFTVPAGKRLRLWGQAVQVNQPCHDCCLDFMIRNLGKLQLMAKISRLFSIVCSSGIRGGAARYGDVQFVYWL